MSGSATSTRGRPTAGRDSGRERLLVAARQEFAEHGYDATTVEQLVVAAQVTPPTLYHHYGNKAGLFAAAARDVYAQVLERFRSTWPDPPSFDACIDQILTAAVQLTAEDPSLSAMVLSLQLEIRRHPPLEQRIRPILAEFRAFFDDVVDLAPAELVRSAGGPEALSRALLALVNGLNSEWLLLRNPADFPPIVAAMKSLIHPSAAR